MLENPNQKEGIKSRHDVIEPGIKNGGIKSRSNAREHEKKTKGSNPGAMPENLKENKGIESGRDAGESETKGLD